MHDPRMPPEGIQRVPRGLSNLLSLQSGRTPVALDNSIVGVLELLQFYGLTQNQTAQTQNAAAAEGTSVVVIPSASAWTMLFGAWVQIVKTATMTALRGALSVQRSPSNLLMRVNEAELGPFGATETGICTVPFFFPYPLLLPPGGSVVGSAAIIGTDATADVTVRCEFGLLG